MSDYYLLKKDSALCNWTADISCMPNTQGRVTPRVDCSGLFRELPNIRVPYLLAISSVYKDRERQIMQAGRPRCEEMSTLPWRRPAEAVRPVRVLTLLYVSSVLTSCKLLLTHCNIYWRTVVSNWFLLTLSSLTERNWVGTHWALSIFKIKRNLSMGEKKILSVPFENMIVVHPFHPPLMEPKTLLFSQKSSPFFHVLIQMNPLNLLFIT